MNTIFCCEKCRGRAFRPGRANRFVYLSAVMTGMGRSLPDISYLRLSALQRNLICIQPSTRISGTFNN